MTHFYLYITADSTIDRESMFFMVGIGESERMRKHQAWLEAFAYEHGHFFVKWTSEAVEFCRKCLDSVGLKMDSVKAVKAPDLVKFLGYGEKAPIFYQSAINRHHVLMQVDSNYYFYNTIGKKKKQSPSK